MGMDGDGWGGGGGESLMPCIRHSHGVRAPHDSATRDRAPSQPWAPAAAAVSCILTPRMLSNSERPRGCT